MRDSVPSPRYSPVCNVLRQWKTSLILTYRVLLIEFTDSMIVHAVTRMSKLYNYIYIYLRYEQVCGCTIHNEL